jgi:hypothetical protein
VPILDSNSGGGGEPLRVIERSTFGHGGAALFPRKSRMKRGVEKENAH